MGGRAGGHTMFLKSGKLYYVYNFLGMEEQRVVAGESLPTGDVVLGVVFNKETENPKAVANGTLTLKCNDKVIGQGKIRTQPSKFSLSGGGLRVGQMAADSVTKEYKAPFLWSGGGLKSVTFNVSGEKYADLETEALAMLSRE